MSKGRQRGILQDLCEGIPELLYSLRSNLAAPNGPKHNVLEMFFWEETRTYCTSVGSDNGFKDFISIPYGNSFTSITGAQGEPALVCEKYRAPVADLPILVFLSKCQSSSTVLGSEHRAH
ncbi:hypothetical protein D4764_13G0012580 [Takifugu flavidus]|uniref:Uncharacterized protein n=1 Tax=Takifugu flavidus TaxID=433684 RepID=A0A5C6PBJ1_9TELE|nr:hypothetical protein D4764_13G0012580 [Takifugu flavidus]